jgi:hypothetical protein
LTEKEILPSPLIYMLAEKVKGKKEKIEHVLIFYTDTSIKIHFKILPFFVSNERLI